MSARFPFAIALSAVLLIGANLLLSGCSTSTPKPATSVEQPGHAGHSHGNHTKIEAALAKLSPDDREAATKQKACPVSDEPLGSMGVPKKIKVGERDVFICCDGCEEDLLKNSEKYLAKLSP